MFNRNVIRIVSITLSFLLMFTIIDGEVVLAKQSSEYDYASFTDSDGKLNEIKTYKNSEEIVVELFIDGQLEQRAIVDNETKNITGFTDRGKNKIDTKIDKVLSLKFEELQENNEYITNSEFQIQSSNPVGQLIDSYWHPMLERMGYLYLNVTQSYSNQIYLTFGANTPLSAIIGALLGYVIFYNFSSQTLTSLVVSISTGIVSGYLVESLSARYQTITTRHNYQVWCNQYLAYSPFKEYKYAWGYNTQYGYEETVYNGQSGGTVENNFQMLNEGIYRAALAGY